MRALIVGGVLVCAIASAPLVYEHAACRSAVQRLEAAGRARGERAERMRGEQGQGPKRDALARRMAASHVGVTLPAALRQLGEIAARVHLSPSSVLVLPPVRVDVENATGPAPWMEEYPVQLTVPGSLDGLLRFVEELAQAKLPLRIDWVRVNDRSSDPTRGVVLQMGVRILVPAAEKS
jgi:hypothetical protein